MNIKSISAYTVFDSRGVPTVEAEVHLDNGCTGIGTVPSGASTGQFEALELRDGDRNHFFGKSVFKAIEHVQGELADKLKGMDVEDQRALDGRMLELDGTPNKSRLGANAILAVSMAAAKAAAAYRGVPLHAQLGSGTLLPLPEIQILGGGAHADWQTDLQDFLVIANGAQTYEETLEITHNVYHTCGAILKSRGQRTGLADEGGYWPVFTSHEEMFELMVDSIREAGYIPGKDASISLDIAASDLFDAKNGTYRLNLEGEALSSDAFADRVMDWCTRYPVISIEDPMADTDWQGWRRVFDALGDRVQIIGDDLFTTNPGRIRRGIDAGVANAVLIKLNQIGTVTETLDAIRLTQEAGWLPVISARSGETEDAFISHLAVASDAGQLKVGSFARSERMAKWNEVLRISRGLGEQAQFVGAGLYDPVFSFTTA